MKESAVILSEAKDPCISLTPVTYSIAPTTAAVSSAAAKRRSRWTPAFAFDFAITLASFFLIAGMSAQIGAAQSSSETNQASSAPATRPFTFEVVSIRRHDPAINGFDTHYLPDGFQATTAFAAFISMAYTPNTGYIASRSRLVNAPAWAYSEFYDLQARVSQTDLAVWQEDHDKNHDVFRSELWRQGLRAALEDRAKLVVHTSNEEQSCLDLVMGKQGPRLQPAAPGPIKTVPGKTSVLGEGFYVQDNGKRQFLSVSMEELALLLTRLNNGHLVQDKTGLTGRYDFTFAVDSSPDIDGSSTIALDRMPVTSIGLALKPGTAPLLNIISTTSRGPMLTEHCQLRADNSCARRSA